MTEKTKVIDIFLDKEKTQKITGSEIDIGILEAGKETVITLFVENLIRFPINTKIKLDNEMIQAGSIIIKDAFDIIVPKQTKEIKLSVEPKVTSLKPVAAKLKVDMEYVVR